LAAIEALARRQGRGRLNGIPHPHKKRSGHSRKDYSSARVPPETPLQNEPKKAGNQRASIQV
jgi:hypothetical protein